MVAKSARILVVGGAGTMGSSTALELARRGYTDVRILDMYQTPSANSAGNDMNKMISTQYVNGIWGRLAFETWDAWLSDPLFKPFLHQTGRVGEASRTGTLRKQYRASLNASRRVEWLDGADAIIRHFPQLDRRQLEGFVGLYVEEGGWVAARDALDAVGQELRRLDVKSAFGSTGTFAGLVLNNEGICTGVRTADGTIWDADVVVMATGAWSPSLIDLEGQCESKCWQFGHLQLDRDEVQSLRGCPSLYCSEIGFFMEPSDTGLMKFVNEFEGYTYHSSCRPFGSTSDQTLSVPRSHAQHPTDGIPDEGRKAIHRVIDTFLPQLSGRQLVGEAICWCTDSFDGNWLLCPHPKYSNVFLATGDSGHTFKMLPIVGRYVVDLIEGKLSPEDKELWRWRAERVGQAVAREGPKPRDLAEVKGWKNEAKM